MWLNPEITRHFRQQVEQRGAVVLELPTTPDRFQTPDGSERINVCIAETSGGDYVVMVPNEVTSRETILQPLFQGDFFIQGWRVLPLPRSTSMDVALAQAAHLANGDLTTFPGADGASRESPSMTPGAAPSPSASGIPGVERHIHEVHPQHQSHADPIRVPGAAREQAAGSGAGELPFSRNLTAAARRGELATIAGREAELLQVVTVLLQRERNSPLLSGEPGVGKTAIVEKLALLSAQAEVLPPRLRGAEVFALDVPSLLASSSHKGAVERNVTHLLKRLERQPLWILFADEIHTLTEARGDITIAEMLKPSLARGLRLIGATTHDEFKTKLSPDPALVRRFDIINVNEPDERETLTILRARLPHLEAHHGVRVPPELLEHLVRLADEYFPDRYRPDKALTLLDRAMAAQSLKSAGRGTTP